MKLIPTLATAALLSVGSAAFATPISLDSIGGADKLVAWASLSNSGDASERAFIASYLDVAPNSISYSHLSSGESGGKSGAWDPVIGQSSLYAFDFDSDAPAYFLIKTGAGVGVEGIVGTFTHFLFENVNALSYGVIDLSLFTRTQGKLEIGVVSHVSTSGKATSVPEPGTLGLLAVGLAGLAFARRRKPQA